MPNQTKRSLYITLFGILGFAVFTIIEQGLLLVAFWLKIDLNESIVQIADYLLKLIAGFLGLWYGVHMGNFWHDRIYGERGGISSDIQQKPEQKSSNPLYASQDWEIEELIAKPSNSRANKIKPKNGKITVDTKSPKTKKPAYNVNPRLSKSQV